MKWDPDGRTRTWILIILAVIVSPVTEHSGQAVGIAIAMMLITWIAFRSGRGAVARLGSKAWWLLLQLAGWFCGFLWLAPLDDVVKLIIVWCIAIPLVMIGAAYRRLAEWSPSVESAAIWIAKFFGTFVLVSLPFLAWREGWGFWLTIARELATLIMTAIPLYYGWRLAEREPRVKHDAKFGDDEDFQRRGMSGER